jgi:dihydrofolate reductase
MREIVVFLATSIDGYTETTDRGIDWHVVDDEFNDFAVQQLSTADTLMFGRITYDLMASYWPTEAAQADDDAVTPLMNDIDKIVVSRTLTEPAWQPTRVIGEDAFARIAELKAQPGRTILVFGSSTLVAGLLDAGLVDELRIMVMPVVLGAGISVLTAVSGRRPLTLADVRRFGSGNVLLSYRP